MRRLVLLPALLICFAGLASAQPKPEAVKFDEFGDVYPTDAASRLDNFAIQLQEQPTAKGFIIGYRSFRDLPGLSKRRVNWMRSYLIYSRGLKAERVEAIDGGQAGCLMHEFWVVPAGAAPTPRADAYSRGFHDLEIARKFDEYYYTIPEDDLVSFSTEYEGGLEGFAEALRKEPRSFAYIIAYAEYQFQPREDQKGTRKRARIDPSGTALKKLNAKKGELVKAFRISPSRVRIVDGGYRHARAVELWIVPRGALPPRPTPNMAPPPRGLGVWKPGE